MAVTKKSSTAPVKKVKVDNSAAAKAERKEAKAKRKPKLAQIRAKARQDYQSLTPAEKNHLAERNIYTAAIRHGASASEAKAEVMKYRARKKLKAKGKHATAQRKALHDGTREIRQKLKADLAGARDALKKAREHNKSIKDPKARANANAKAKDAYVKTAGKIAAARAKATDAKKNKLKDIHEKMQSLKKVFKKPTTKKGVRLVSEDKAAAKPAAEGKKPKAEKVKVAGKRASKMGPNDGPQISKNRLTRRRNQMAKDEAEKAAAAPAKKERKPRKPKETAAAPAPAAAAPKAKGKGGRKPKHQMGPNDGPQISKNRLTRRRNAAAKEEAEKAAAKPAKAPRKPRTPKAPAAPAPAAKPAKAPKAPKAESKPAAATKPAKAPKAPKASTKAPKAPAKEAPAPKASGGIRRR